MEEKLSSEAIEDTANKTIEQSKCKLWFDSRRNRLTASNFFEVIRRKKRVDDSFMDKLIGTVDLSGVKPLNGASYTRKNRRSIEEI